MARRAVLSEQIFNEIRRRILAGEFPDRLKLPTEEVLCERFNVSRTAVRAAMARLREEGLINTVRGSGSFVVNPGGQDGSASMSSIADLVQCQETRLILEGDLAALAAERRTAEDLVAIEQAIADVRDGQAWVGSAENDFAFHVAVIRAAKNDFALSLFFTLRPQLVFITHLGRSLLPLMPEYRMQHVLAEHQLIFEAIRDRKPALARANMRAHVDFFRRALLDGDKW